jgi:hypothetical protein
VKRVNRIRLARELHVLPAQIDALSIHDYADLVSVINAEREVDRVRQHRQQAQAKARQFRR